MENNYDNFTAYRANLRYKYFNNNKYSNMSEFRCETHACSFWDTNFFNHIYKTPNDPDHICGLRLQKFLDSEINQPTIDWTNMFNYISALKEHPYFKSYHDRSGTNGDNQFWDILNKYKQALTGQIRNNQQVWI